MRYRRLVICGAALLLGGCGPRVEPLAASPPSTEAPKPSNAKPAPPSGPQRKVDDFNLPLTITITPPEVPKEIEGPSPPLPPELQQQKKSPTWLWW